MATPSLNLTQFGLTNTVGALSRGPQPGTLTAKIDPNSVATGMGVATVFTLVSLASAGDQIIVDAITTATAALPFGVAFINTKKNTYAAGDVLELACKDDTIYLEAAGAITAGTTVSIGLDGTNPTVAQDTTSGHYVLGLALTRAASAGDIILVRVQPALLP